MKILFATDGSVHAEAALCLLNRFPFPAESELTLLDVLEWPPSFVSELEQQELLQDWNEQLHLEMKATLARQASSLERAGWKVSTATREGHAAREIVAAAEELGADLVVVGSHGRGAVKRFLLGSISDAVVKHAPCSVLVVREPQAHSTAGSSDDRAGNSRLKILLAFDDSAAAQRAVQTLHSLPLGTDAELTVLSVMTVVKRYRMDIIEHASEFWRKEKEAADAALQLATASLREAMPHVDSILVESESIARAVLDKAEDMHADLIILGHTGKSAIDRFLLGSVSNRVVHHAPCSTWIVR